MNPSIRKNVPFRGLVTTLYLASLVGTLQSATLDLTTATIADLQAAFRAGLTAETLTAAYLSRIEAYDKKGPAINSVITLNPRALDEARARDSERRAGKVRGPLHGIPVALKDNIDTVDLATTGGSQLLEGSLPPDDAFIVRRLRAAGAIVIAKVNLSEWAGSGGSATGAPTNVAKAARVPNGFSSAGGQTLNPHDLTRGPAGSSGGTGAALAAGFAQFGIGTDTGGSIRGPSSANGIVGIKPTRGLMSRDGIIPLGLSFDTAGPMARSVHDVAASLGAMTGVDAADPATSASRGKFHRDYTRFLKTGSLRGARLGVLRDFMGQDAETDRVVEAAIVRLKGLGAVIIDPIRYPEHLRKGRQDLYNLVVRAEFKADLTTYLKTTRPGFPKSFDEVVTLSNDPATGYHSPGKAVGLKWSAAPEVSFEVSDPVYLATRDQMLPAVRAAIDAVLAKHRLDAVIYPTAPRPAQLIHPLDESARGESATSFANFTGYPDVIVPAGMTRDGLPVTLSFFGTAWSEPKLLGYAYDFEQATLARVLPRHTPALASDILTY
jgi:amidase